MKCSLLASFVCAALLAFAPVVGAQVQTGLQPLGSFAGGPDTINLGNLNVHLTFPVFAKEGRGIPFQYALGYESSVWYSVNASWQPVSNWGWHGPSDFLIGGYVDVKLQGHTCWDPTTGTIVSYYSRIFGPFHDRVGTVHPVSGATETDPPLGGASPLGATSQPRPSLPDCGTTGSTTTGTTTDGSGYTVIPTGGSNVQIISPSGFQIGPSVGATDTNGNVVSDLGSTFTDTLGMTALTLSGTAPNPVTYTYTDSSGAARSVTVTYATFTVQTNFGCPGIGEYGPASVSLVNSISYPDSTSYSFTYEPTPGTSGKVTGRMQSITLRTGGQITYSYTGGNNGVLCADGSTAGLTRTRAMARLHIRALARERPGQPPSPTPKPTRLSSIS